MEPNCFSIAYVFTTYDQPYNPLTIKGFRFKKIVANVISQEPPRGKSMNESNMEREWMHAKRGELEWISIALR